jgi:hypothetical protein
MESRGHFSLCKSVKYQRLRQFLKNLCMQHDNLKKTESAIKISYPTLLKMVSTYALSLVFSLQLVIPNFFKSLSTLSLHLCPDLPLGLLNSIFLVYTLLVYLLSSIVSICPNHLNLLIFITLWWE